LTVTGNTVNNGTIFASNTLNAVTAIEFQGNYTSSPAGRLVGSPTTNPDIQFNGNVILGELTLNGNRIIFAAAGTQELSVALPAAPQIDGNVLVRRGSTVNLLANSAIVQTNTRTLELEGELLLMAAAVLDVSLGSWHIGAGLAIPNSFTGNDGQLVLGTGSQLITNHFNLPGGAGPAFIVDNTGHASISIGGNANIADNTNVDLDGGGDLPLLVLEMARTGNQIQNLITDQILGSLLVGTASQTVLWTPATYPDPLLQGTISFRGRVKIESAAAPAGLVAGNHDIIMYAGLTGNRDLTLHLQDGPDTVYYTRWETTAPLPPSLMPPFTGVPNMNDFVFRQNAGREVSFRRDPTVSNLHPVFFEIAGNTFWRTFECTEPGAVIQFSRHPHHHTISGRFTVQGPAGGSNQDFVTITRFMEHRPEDTVIWPSEDAATFPFLFDQSLGMEPPFRLWAGGTANFGDLGQWALPVFIPSINLKLNSIPMERERTKYWNLNLLNNADVRPLEYFRRVTILFSHAYNTRIPVLREAMQLEVVPYFDPVAGTGFFNYDWLELRKILYSFTEDFTGNGRLDRIRVQTNISLYADFSAFDVYVEGFEINRCDQWALGHGLVGFYNGFQLVSDFTGDTGFDNDSFFIYLIERPDFDTGSTPRWSVIRNESLRDEIARDSLVGEPGIDVNMIPFSTIPPRISYTLTLPGHPQTFVRMSEPVVSGTQGNNITNDIAGMALDNARVEIPGAATTFSWRYTPLDGAEVVHTVNVPAGDLAFILEWQNAFSTGDLAALNNIFGDPTSSMTLGYFMMSDVVDQGQRPMDWSDWNIDPAFFLYYQPPKLPLNWGYTSFARVYGNQHLRDHPDLPNDFDQDHPNATSAAGTVPLSDVFLPPNRLLTPEMMTLLAQGDGHLVTPSMFVPNYDVYRRVTDALVSIPPSQDNASNFFAWPVFAEHQDLPNPDGFPNIDSGWWTRPQDYDNPGIIWVFDGTAF
ncbi:MAG: hypothetical protein FWC97_12145, partial [Treponema sp.]|nr:hypothetical protein [Treponema sp.]